MSIDKINKILKTNNQNLNYLDLQKFKIDTKTRNKNLVNIDDESLIKLFANVNYDALDKSSYESANKLLDLNSTRLPKKFYSKYDFIYDGGTLDNLFSPSNAIINFSKMLNNKGRILHSNMSGAWPGAYSSFSCEWFYSFYSNNNYKNVQVFLLVPFRGKWPNPDYYVYLYNPYFTRKKNYNPLEAIKKFDIRGSTVICYAEKNNLSTNIRIPIQSHYIEREDFDWRKKSKLYQKNKLNNLFVNKISSQKKPFLSNHYKLLGTLI